MRIRQFIDEGLGNSSYLLISEQAGVAALIDPQRDVDRYLDAAAVAGVRITHAFETHLHADFISGSRELAARVGARTCASAAAELGFDHLPLADGDHVVVGDVKLTALATPGHTPEHLSYLAEDLGAPDQPPVLFSGGSLLVGAVARTDLVDHEHTVGLAHQLFHSLHDKILRLPDDVAVYPTHGAGSFCAAVTSAAHHTTIGWERQFNPLLQLATPEEFAAELLRSLPSYPAYFGQPRAINQRGPRVLGGLPALAPLPPREVQTRQSRGEAVVDLRPVLRYAEGHIPGAYHVELRPAFATWVGWVVPFGTPVILVSDASDAHEEAVRQLIRIGYDNLPGYLAGGMAAWEQAHLPVERLPVLTVAEVRARLARGEPLVVLDVRQDAEWRAGHISRAHHVEAGALAAADLALLHDGPIATHCGHQSRAATALSILERRGYANTFLIAGGLSAWEEAGFAVERPGPTSP
ncbi:MAG: MBL fold metallo-hydrolase [Chloroflexi bacterium]|nr:MBL fold metallo-hydrolase [Chloroflexota bacterium]